VDSQYIDWNGLYLSNNWTGENGRQIYEYSWYSYSFRTNISTDENTNYTFYFYGPNKKYTL